MKKTSRHLRVRIRNPFLKWKRDKCWIQAYLRLIHLLSTVPCHYHSRLQFQKIWLLFCKFIFYRWGDVGHTPRIKEQQPQPYKKLTYKISTVYAKKNLWLRTGIMHIDDFLKTSPHQKLQGQIQQLPYSPSFNIDLLPICWFRSLKVYI